MKVNSYQPSFAGLITIPRKNLTNLQECLLDPRFNFNVVNSVDGRINVGDLSHSDSNEIKIVNADNDTAKESKALALMQALNIRGYKYYN